MTHAILPALSWRPRLELLSRTPRGDQRPTPLLFVHGAYCGAWCWDEHFLPYFAEHGYAAHAVSLRGHGRSAGHEVLPMASLSHYVDDVARVVGQLERPPVIIGHSMGGLVVQRYLERYPAPAAVLMASVPPQGLWLPALSLAMRDWQALQQLNVAQFMGGGCVSVESMRRTLFSADMPDAEVARHLQRFQGESACALLEMTMPRPWWDLYWAWGCGQRPNHVKPPVLVLAADKDAFFSHEMAEETAASFGTQAVVVPGLAHVMMLEARWKAAAERILAWLQRLGL